MTAYRSGDLVPRADGDVVAYYWDNPERQHRWEPTFVPVDATSRGSLIADGYVERGLVPAAALATVQADLARVTAENERMKGAVTQAVAQTTDQRDTAYDRIKELLARVEVLEGECAKLTADCTSLIESEIVAHCEGCGAWLLATDDYVSDPDGVNGCWAAMTDLPSKRPRPCYAYHVGKADAQAALEPKP